MDGSPPLRERASGSYGIRYARHGADTTERRNHLGGTPQQQRQPQCTGIHSPGTRPCICRQISGSTDARHRKGHGKEQFGNALSKLWRPADRVSRTYPLHELLPGTKSRLCPYPRPLCSGWVAIPARNHHFIYRSGNYGTFNRQPSGTDYFQRSTHLPSSGCRRHFRRGKLRNTFRRIFPARRTERQSGVSGKTDRPEHWRSDGMCRRCAFSRRSR